MSLFCLFGQLLFLNDFMGPRKLFQFCCDMHFHRLVPTWSGLHMDRDGEGKGKFCCPALDCVQCSECVQPHPVGVSMYSREQGWGGTACLCHMLSLLPLMFGDYHYTHVLISTGHHCCPALNICPPPLFYYSSFPLLSVMLPLSVFLIHTQTWPAAPLPSLYQEHSALFILQSSTFLTR